MRPVVEIGNAPNPPVTELDAGDDREWFAEHPGRRFHGRQVRDGWWLIRLSGKDALLRVFMSAHGRAPDADGELAPLWFAAAWPNWTPEQVRKAARKALRKPPAAPPQIVTKGGRS